MPITWRLADALRKFRAMVRSTGWLKALRWAWFGAMRVNSFELYVAPASGGRVLPTTSIELTPLAEEERKQLAECLDFSSSEARVSEFAGGAQCYVGRLGDRPVHLLWVFDRSCGSRFFDLGHGELEINYCFTPEPLRGRKIYRDALVAAVAMLRDGGTARVYIATHAENHPARKAIEGAGFIRLGTLRHVGAFYRPKWKVARGSFPGANCEPASEGNGAGAQ